MIMGSCTVKPVKPYFPALFVTVIPIRNEPVSLILVRRMSHTLSTGTIRSLLTPPLSLFFTKEKEKTPPVVSSAVLPPLRAVSWQSMGLPGSRLGVEGVGVVAPQMYNASPSGQGGRPLLR